jgi:hypothetical protein
MVSKKLNLTTMLKTIIKFSIAAIFIAPKLYCQTKCADPIEIDFSNLKDEYKCYVDYRKSQEIKIININRKVYAIDETKTEKDFNTTVPASIAGIKLPSFLLLGKLPRPTVAVSPDANLPTDLAFKNEGTETQDAIPAYFAEIKRRARRLNDAVFLFNDINGLSKDCSRKAEEIRKALNELTDTYLHGKLTNPAPDASALFKELRDSLQTMRKGAEDILEHLKDIIDQYTSSISKKFKDAISTAESQIPEEQKILDDKKATKQEKENAKKEINRYEAIKKVKEKELADFSDQAKELSDNLEKAEETVTAMYTFEKEDNSRSILNAFSLVNSPNYFSYTAKLTKAKKDKTTYTFTITPKDVNECTKEDKKVIEVELLTKGGLKVDFSTGAFVNFGNEDFLGQTYYYKNLTDSTRQIVSAKRSNRLMLAVGALMHFYKRSPACLKFGGSLGVSTTADFETLNFHAGPSLIFGSENRFILTAGLTFKTSSQLDRQLDMNTTYTKLESPDDIPTVKVFPKAGAFISITYNISKFSKE